MTTTAIITAAGQGKRMGSATPKQFLELHGKPIICHTMERFQMAPSVDSIVITVGEDDIEGFKNDILKWWPSPKVKKIVVGGAKRQDSVWAGIQAIDWECEYIAVHDGVRPLVLVENIEDVIKNAKATGAAILATPLKETIKRVNGLRIEETVDRSILWGAKTPQVFKKDLLIQGYEKAFADGFVGTDDASLVERLGYEVSIVPGNDNNIKITTPEDLLIAEAILKE
ncbi:2-C-methyl-D-erythritol 4-phosphate cytidylyltransferase [bacterium]|nr:2-C-methyl-D-erythritol 4-phosphate cytidylyltransferase [bacterium]